MQASPMYQEMQSWAREEARAWALQEVREEVREEVRGEIEGERRSIALNMIQENLPIEAIARITGLTIAQLQQLQDDRIN